MGREEEEVRRIIRTAASLLHWLNIETTSAANKVLRYFSFGYIDPFYVWFYRSFLRLELSCSVIGGGGGGGSFGYIDPFYVWFYRSFLRLELSCSVIGGGGGGGGVDKTSG